MRLLKGVKAFRPYQFKRIIKSHLT